VNRFAIGIIVKAFGIKGEVIVQPMSHQPGRFRKLARVFVGRSDDSVKETVVEHVAIEKRGVRVKFAVVNDRTAAEKIVGSLLFVDEVDRLRPRKGAYFIHDVVGMRVVDESGKSIGTVKDVLQLPAHDVYVIETHNREIMLPAVKEFVRSIDIEKKIMNVTLIEGMAE
jgi:16S rRNA processing protein RimM